MAEAATPRRIRLLATALGLMAAGALLLAGGVTLGDVWFNGGRMVSAALGRDALTRSCADTLVRQLSERGFEPAEVEFGDAPRVAFPWDRDRRYGSHFTFRDGAGQVRVDGVMACLVSGETVTVEFRVASTPHRLG